ncbi:Zinc finger, C2H2-like protein [Cordyceps fumosorosea ARSEF 2679]|uniref:Zinc finger, C2H2-like protein n=1 Tax=Cordyceps fumosorosea (strain ARSEF 2679) TaxID=1081104 RepID=A0A167JGM2_CORFA|nr:Zinc finger, C2H2-like protein [Cordyceps fumosorosea ARSEF 2679]OAA50233.1 Zinc finger, C2H2-like protein [Cordyceps fumosorosea ARSEF 2679]
MEPAGKRRKLAPKLSATACSPPEPHSAPSHQHNPPHPSHIVPDAPHHSQCHEFEAFARHLHNAAILINQQAARPNALYANVSVLLLGWQDDAAALDNIRALQQVLVSDYRYHVQTWQIPSVASPSIKLSMQIASFIEHARPNHLLIIYYSGHGYVSPDEQLYWACSPHSHSAKLKWEGVRCLFEDAQSDILLLLDTYAAPDSFASGNSVKQVIAACSAETSRQPSAASRAYFSPCLTAALHQLSRATSFSAEQLCQEIKIASQSNSSPRFPSPAVEPQFFTLTPDQGKSIQLAPLIDSSSDAATPETVRPRDAPLSPNTSPKLNFDEARVLVCTTFVGDVSPDISAFHSWLRNTAPLAAQITVEGMFLGPPTILFISMPTALWASVQHDKIWCYLGTITSRNMISLYEKMVGASAAPASAIETNTAATAAPESTPTSAHSRPAPGAQWPLLGYAVKDEQPDGQTSPTARLYQSLAASGLGIKPPKPPGTESVEMQEAAEQLKALSHVRHRSGDAATTTTSPQRAALPASMPTLHPGFRNLTRSESMPVLDSGTGSTCARMRRMLGKPDIRCDHCCHAPFKDSSSLRKHIAAAHTRPFPCAFHFAGCTSTFGSKNEWKRHITSQHLCLQYYRCSLCSQNPVDGKGNDFNRKDLFTQHLRRMHAPLEVKRALAQDDSGRHQSEWESYVRDMQTTCLIQRRHPPQRSSCPKPGCGNTFEGSSAWDEWTEHVGRHMETGEGDNIGVDNLLLRYALEEGVIERVGDKYKLCQVMVSSGTPSLPPVRLCQKPES